MAVTQKKKRQVSYDDRLDPYFNVQELFESKRYCLLELGKVRIPTGKIVVSDPLCYLGTELADRLSISIPPGDYPVTLSIIEHPGIGTKYMAAKMQISQKRSVRFQLALGEGQSAEQLDGEGDLLGFGVDTGLGCICDIETEKKFNGFLEQWQKNHPGKNYYDDYFEDEFLKSFQNRPIYQRNGGDWINWNIPGDPDNIIMFNSGFGDGYYPCYWGYDEHGEINCLIISFIHPYIVEQMKVEGRVLAN